MGYTFGNPAPPRQFKAVEYIGEVVIVIKGGVHEAIATRDYGTKPATRVTVIVLTGRDAGEVFEDTLLWAKQHDTFRDEAPGAATLCRVMAQGKGALFDVASDYDRKVAASWIEDNDARFNKLLAEAVGNFHDREREMAEPRRSDTTPVARQFDATRSSLRDPQAAATEEEAGY